MGNAEIIQKRKNFIDLISGEWESVAFVDSEFKKKCNITFSIDDKFGLTTNPIFIKANKKYSNSNSPEIITIVFWWVNVFLTSNIL